MITHYAPDVSTGGWVRAACGVEFLLSRKRTTNIVNQVSCRSCRGTVAFRRDCYGPLTSEKLRESANGGTVYDVRLLLAWHDVTCPDEMNCGSRVSHAMRSEVEASTLRAFIHRARVLNEQKPNEADEFAKFGDAWARLSAIASVGVAEDPNKTEVLFTSGERMTVTIPVEKVVDTMMALAVLRDRNNEREVGA